MYYELKEQEFHTNIQKAYKGLIALDDLFMKVDVMMRLGGIYASTQNDRIREAIYSIATESLGISQEGFVDTAVQKIKDAIHYIADKLRKAYDWIVEKITKAINWIKSKFIKKKVEEAEKKKESSKEAFVPGGVKAKMVPLNAIVPDINEMLRGFDRFLMYDPAKESKDDAIADINSKKDKICEWLTTKPEIVMSTDNVIKCLTIAKALIGSISQSVTRFEKAVDETASRANSKTENNGAQARYFQDRASVLKEVVSAYTVIVSKVNAAVNTFMHALTGRDDE